MATTTQKITPFLWFDDKAEEAVKLYVSVFKNSKITDIARYGEEGSKVSGVPKGKVMTVGFKLNGQNFAAINGGPIFKFNESISFFVRCKTEEEINEIWAKLSKNGSVNMKLNKYPFAEKYGWCKDKYGMSWQLILSKGKQKISPALLFVQKKFGKGEEAMKFYMSIFKNSKTKLIARDEQTKSILHATFTLQGQEFVITESGMKEHKFDFSPATSFVVNCKTQKEIDYYWEKLSFNKKAEQCGWLQDKYGISWQIVPSELGKLMQSKNTKKSERVMAAMLQMKKIDIKKLKEAYNKK